MVFMVIRLLDQPIDHWNGIFFGKVTSKLKQRELRDNFVVNIISNKSEQSGAIASTGFYR